MTQDNQKDCDCHFSKALFVYHSSIHESTGFIPYHLNFGCSSCLPIDVFLGCSLIANRTSHTSYPAFVCSVHHQLKQAVELTCQCIKKQHQCHKQLYDKHARVEEFDIVDQVWLYTPAVKPGQSKLLSMWKGS